ncbi:MAG: hypothetical protein KGL29_10510 [Alphaproteobacteria bacterium]|nr:hypothetical protein [Alphaproteobacteria bacterium]MDE2266321.1 hypothetical protein [Alphaproteobacteria bacterium]MDE2498926.1 hypothetical protein [Alphaproteobacteria bacterium]
MNIASRQATIGALVAVALVVGANANPDIQLSTASSAILTAGTQRCMNVVRERLGMVAVDVFSGALDLAGEVAARLKQM